MANNRVNVSLAFTADTKQAKQQIDQLQNSLSKLATFDHFEAGDIISQDLIQASNAVTKLQSQLKSAFNVDTGKIDLSKFKQQMDASGMSIEKYRDALVKFGPQGEKAFMQMAQSIQNAEIPLRRSGKLANELWTTLKNTARWQLSASVLQGFQGALQKAYGYAQDLNKSLTDIRIVTEASVDDMAKFAVEANKAAKALSTTTTEYTNASLIYYQQGLSAEEVKERTDVTVKMANVTRESAETISDQMTAVWNNFDDGSKSLEYYADVMTALGAATASSTAEITTGLEKFAAVAETVGLSYEYATTALATITDTTRQSADVVGNALKTLFARIQGLSLGETLEDGTDLTKYSEALAKVGISIKEQDGSLKEMDDILDEMANRWQTLNKDQQVALAQTVAGVRQYTQLVALMDNWDKFQKNLSVAQGAEGALQKQADIYEESWEASSKRVKAALEAIFNDLVDDDFFIGFNDALADMISLLDQVIDNFGGLKGVVAGLGVVLTKVFNKQITQSISNLGFNLRQQWTNGSEEEAIKAKAAQALSTLYEEGQKDPNSSFYGVSESTVRNYDRIAELQIKLNKNAAYQTEEQKNINNQLIERLQKINELIAASEKAAKIAEGKADITAGKIDKHNNQKGVNSKTASAAVENYKNTNQALGMAKYYKELDELAKKGKVSKEVLESVRTEINQLLGPNGPKFSGDDIEKEIKDIGTAADKAATEVEKLKKGIKKPILKQGAQEAQDAGRKKGIATAQFQMGEEATNDSDIPDPEEFEGWAQGITDVASGISQLTFGFQSLISIQDTLNNQDLSWGEKTLSIIQQLSFGIPSLINGFGQFTTGLGAIGAGLGKLGPVIKAGKISWITYKGATDVADFSLKKVQLTILGTEVMLGKFLIILGAVIAVVAALTWAWDRWKSKQPEALLKNATKEADHFKEAIADTAQEVEALKDAFDNYESIQQTLANCTKGTKEWAEALANANTNVLELIEKYPQLAEYMTRDETTGQLSFKDGYENIIDDYEKKANALRAAATVANSQQNELDHQVREEEIKKQANTYRGRAGYGIDDKGYSLLKEAIEAGTVTTTESAIKLLQANGYVNAENVADHDLIQGGGQFDTTSVQNLITSIRQLNATTATNNLLTKENSTEYARLTLTENKKVQNSTEKAYIEAAVGEALPDIIKEIRGDQSNEDIYSAYTAAYGSFAEGSKWNAETGQVTDKDGNILATVGEMVAELYATEITTAINAKANELTSVLANRNSAESGVAVLNGTGDVGNLTGAEYKELFANQELVPEALKTAFNNIDPTVFEDGLDGLEYSLAAGLRKTMGDNSALIGDIFENLGADSAEKVASIINQIDWSNWDADDNFATALNEAGLAGKITAEDFELLTNSLRDSNNAVKNIELDTFKGELFDIKGLIGELEKGDTIKAEDWAQLTDAEKEYFTLTSDGTYMLTEDAKKFYDVVMNGRIDEAKEKIEELQKATQSGRSGYADYLRYTKDGNELTGEQARDILTKGNVDYDADASDEDLIAKANAFAETYKKNTTDLKNWQEAVAASAEEQSELKKMLDEGTISWSVYAKAMTAMKTAQEKAMKSLRSNIAGVSKSAPELEELITLLQDGADVTSVKFIESVEEAINKFPELTGSIMTAYDALQTALPGTQEYTDAWTDFYNILQTNATAQVLEDNANTANEALKILTDEDSSLNELNNAAAQLYNLFGWEIDTSNLEASADKFDMLKKALDGDVTAFERLQRSIAEGILLKFHATSSVDFEALWNGLIETGTLAKEVEQALIDSGAFEVVETTIDTPVVKKDLAPEEQLWLEKLGMDDKGDGFYLNEVSAAAKTAMQAMSIEWKPRKVRLLKPVNSTHAGDFSPSGTDDKDTTPKAATPGTKKKYEDEIDPFYKHKKKLDNLNDLLEEYQHNKEMAFSSKEASDWMDAEIEALKEVRSEYTNYINSVDTKLDGATQLLEQQYGAIIDAQTGTITNYEQIYQKAIDEYNKGIVSTDEEMQKKAEEDFEKFIKALENYEELYRLLIDLMADRRETEAEILQAQLDQIDYMVNKGLAVEDDDLELLEYMINKISDAAFSAADAIAELSKETTNYIAKSDIYRQGLQDLQDLADAQGGWTDEMIEQMREYKTGLLETNEALMELQDTIEEKVNLALDECTQELDKHISRFDIYTQLLQNYNDIIDLSGKKYKDYTLLLELSNKQVDVSIDKLASTKEKLDMLKQSEVDAQTQLANVTAAGAPADVIKYWEDTLEDIQIRIEEANEEMTSTWVEALQAASDAYDNSVQIAIEKMQSALSVFNNLDEMESAYDRAEEISERYLDDFEKVYELNKLSKNIAKDINEISSQYGKNKMAELLEEINELESSNAQISQFELEILQKKYDLKVAEIALEEAQNAKSQVKLTRDNEGNWSYQYTADQESIDEAQQRYDDALYDIEQTSRDYIDEMSGLIIQNQKEMVEALGSIRAADYATEQDYYKALDEVREYYIERDAYLRTELQKGLDNTGTYYAADQVKYAETTLAKLENANSWQEAQANLTNQTNTLINEMMGSYQNWQMKVEEAMVAAGTSSTEFLGTMQGNMSQVDTASENLRKALEEDASTMAGYISSVMQAVGNWQIQYAAKIAQIIEENEKLVASFNAIARAQHYSTATRATAVDYSQRITDYIFNQGGSVKDQAVLDDLYDRSGVYDSFTDEKKSTILNNDQLMDVINKGVEIKGKDESKRTQDEKDLLQFIDNIADNTNGNKYYTLKDLDPFKNVLDVDWLQFDTGGYTGNWGPSGRLAMVHEKELILNPEDTENFLAGINALRQIAQVIDLSAFSMGLGQGFNLPSIGANGSTLEQDVRIEAIFPSVTSRTEIEEAFTTLINTATQYANRK